MSRGGLLRRQRQRGSGYTPIEGATLHGLPAEV
jgi:hypothetical protein